MKCIVLRNRILAEEDPRKLPGELLSHLGNCPACAAWHQALIRMEEALPTLWVPASSGQGKTAVLAAVQAPAVHPAAKLIVPSLLGQFRWTSLWPAGVITVTLMIGFGAWWSLRTTTTTIAEAPADPLLDRVVQANIDVSKAESPAARMKVYARLANDLQQQMRDIARVDTGGENMMALQQNYSNVVIRGIVKQAQLLEPAEREVVLPNAVAQLTEADKAATSLSEEVPWASVNPLREAAKAAREGTQYLEKLLKEKGGAS